MTNHLHLLLHRRSKKKIPRQIAMYLCAIYCSSKVSLSEIGKLFSVSLSGLTRGEDRVKVRISQGKDKELIEAINKIKKLIA